MKLTRLNIIILLGVVAIAGILVLQLLLLKQAFSQEEQKFRQKANVALYEVVKKLYRDSKLGLPELNPVKEIAAGYYVVNVNQEFNASVLEYYLRSEFDKSAIKTDFEYAIYNCETDGMVYGNYVSHDNGNKEPALKDFPRQKNLVYYFAVNFPKKNSAIYASLWIWIVFSVVMFFVLIIYSWSAFKLLQQKKYSELQKDFINNMTHEFKTPLSSILLSSSFLSKQPDIAADEKLKKYADIIIEQAGKLNHHVEKVLGLAKTESDFFKMETEMVDVNKIVAAMAEQVKLKRPDASINISGAQSIFIKADPFHFTNMVYNLLDNSVKYSNGVPVINVTVTKDSNFTQLVFADKGIGIPKKHLANVFDKFYRITGREQNEKNGFGLGLFYVKKICSAHKWKIKAESEENKGTSIIITIPA
jgi:two-component system, OmpR family, phosphate regulon sensor histidine kinase PhoR